MKTLLLHFLLLITATSSLVRKDGQRLFFRKDYTLLEQQDAFYKVHNELVDFGSTIGLCSAEGAELFVPTSQLELDAVSALYVNQVGEGNSMWIGITDAYSEGTFVMVNGKTDFYTNWTQKEPNNGGPRGDEDCVVSERGVGYSDVQCSFLHSFVCKRTTLNLTQNPLCSTYDMGYFYDKDQGKCYKLHKNPKKWSDAYKMCMMEESHLVVVNNEVEAQILIKEMAKHPIRKRKKGVYQEYFFVGFSDILKNGEFIGVDGVAVEDSGYDEWADFNSAGHCGIITRNGTLNNYHCDNRCMFFCEKDIEALNDINVLTRNTLQ